MIFSATSSSWGACEVHREFVQLQPVGSPHLDLGLADLSQYYQLCWHASAPSRTFYHLFRFLPFIGLVTTEWRKFILILTKMFWGGFKFMTWPIEMNVLLLFLWPSQAGYSPWHPEQVWIQPLVVLLSDLCFMHLTWSVAEQQLNCFWTLIVTEDPKFCLGVDGLMLVEYIS